MRDPKLRIEDMLRAIESIERRVAGDRAAFERDEVLQVYAVYHLLILGEAAYRLPASFREQHPHVPWNSMEGMRHILVHDYFRIDLEVVWQVIEHELPPLKRQLQAIMASL